MIPFASRPEWQEALGADLEVRNRVTSSAAQKLTTSEIVELLEIIRTGTADEKDTALRFIAPIVRSLDEAVRAQLPAGWIGVVSQVMREHTWDRAGSLAWNLVLRADRELANQFVLGIAVRGLSEAQLRRLISRLQHVPRSRAFERLIDIAALGGVIGAEAHRTLENLGGIEPAALARIAAEWRRSRSRSALNRLYETYIRHQPVGTSIAPILELLGQPTRQSPCDYRWETDEERPIQLMIRTDASDRLQGFNLK